MTYMWLQLKPSGILHDIIPWIPGSLRAASSQGRLWQHRLHDVPLLRTGMLGLRRPQDGAQPASDGQTTRSCTGAKCRMTHQTQIVNGVLSDMLWPFHRSDSQTLLATSNISSQSFVQRLNHQQPRRKTELELLTGKPSATKWSRSLRWNTTSLRVASFLFGLRMVSVLTNAYPNSTQLQEPTAYREKPSCAKTLPVEDWWTTKWQWCWAGILWTEILFAGLEAEATWMGCSVGYSEEIQSKILHRDRVDTEELPGPSFGRRGYP